MKQTTGEFLATLRRANGFTQQEVAERLGVSNRTLSSWETDRTAPDLLILPAIADLYGVTVDEILRGERKTAGEAAVCLTDGARKSLRKRRYASYGTRRLFCLGFALLGSLIFLAGCAVLLYSSAPLWLSVLLIVIGAGGFAACVILLACFTYSAVRGEGVVLKEDYTEEVKPFILCVRHGAANALLWLSLPYIAGAIVFLVVFYAAGYVDCSVTVGGISVYVDYFTPTVTLVCINAVFALALIACGIALELTGVHSLGTDAQRADAKANGKLLGKIAGFSAIPVVIALILFIVFMYVNPKETISVYFRAKTADEVYNHFQTINYAVDHGEEFIAYYDEESGHKITIKEGSYYFNFQSDSFVRLRRSEVSGETLQFFDLGDGYYGCQKYYNDEWYVYRLYDGMTAEDIKEDEYYGNFMEYIGLSGVQMSINEHGVYWVVNVAYPTGYVIPDENGWEDNGLCRYRSIVALNHRDGVFCYESYILNDYSLPFLIAFLSTAGAAVIADSIAYFIKRKRTDYAF